MFIDGFQIIDNQNFITCKRVAGERKNNAYKKTFFFTYAYFTQVTIVLYLFYTGPKYTLHYFMQVKK